MSLIDKRSPAREGIYAVLLAEPATPWTVRSVWSAIAGRGAKVSQDAVRVTLYMLVQARLARESWQEHSLIFVLTPAGVDRLSRIVQSWRLAGVTISEPASAS